MFRRRTPLTLTARLTGWIWPHGGVRRALRCQVKRVLRVPGSPHAIAAGVAAGVFAAFTPFVGLHIVIAALVALLAGGNILVSAIASLIGNPLTFPVLWFAGFEVGRAVTGAAAQASLEHFIARPSFEQLLPIIEPLTFGSLVLGLGVSALVYLPVRWGVARRQTLRRTLIAARKSMQIVPEPTS